MRIFVHLQIKEARLFTLHKIVDFLIAFFDDCLISIFTEMNITTIVIEVERSALSEIEIGTLNELKTNMQLIQDWSLGKRVK